MSILDYFTKNKEGKAKERVVKTLPPKEDYGIICGKEYDSIKATLDLHPETKKRRVMYKEEEKMKVVKYACSHGVTNATRFFKKEFPNLTESTVRPWVSKYKEEIKKKSAECVIISQTRGRPLLLPAELDEKLRLFITNTRTADGTINKHVIYGILMGLFKAEMTRYGGYLDFTVTKGWLQSLYSRMNMSRRMVTTSRPIVTSSLWEEVRTRFHNDNASAVLKYNITDELILNNDQTPSKFVLAENVTMAETGSKHVSRKGGNNKPWHYCYFVRNNHWKDIAFSIDLHQKNCTLTSIC